MWVWGWNHITRFSGKHFYLLNNLTSPSELWILEITYTHIWFKYGAIDTQTLMNTTSPSLKDLPLESPQLTYYQFLSSWKCPPILQFCHFWNVHMTRMEQCLSYGEWPSSWLGWSSVCPMENGLPSTKQRSCRFVEVLVCTEVCSFLLLNSRPQYGYY